MFKRLAVLAALCLALLTPAAAAPVSRADRVASLVRWSGCTAQVYTSDVISATRSFYMPGEHAVYIGTSDEEPEFVTEMIALHEVGHCLQAQLGYLETLRAVEGQVAVELDADRWAAQLACAMGLDGPRLLHDLFAWAKAEFDYDGDYAHGTLEQRISASDGADYCHAPARQAPLLTRR